MKIIPTPRVVQVMLKLAKPEDVLRLIEIHDSNQAPTSMVEFMGKKEIAKYMADVDDMYEKHLKTT